jgi:hypothetical protein
MRASMSYNRRRELSDGAGCLMFLVLLAVLWIFAELASLKARLGR